MRNRARRLIFRTFVSPFGGRGERSLAGRRNPGVSLRFSLPEAGREDGRAPLAAGALQAVVRRIEAVEVVPAVFVGLALGFGIDHFAGTSPVGIIGGVLLGFAVSVWMAWRTAQRLMAQAKASGVEPKSVPFDDDEVD